MQSYSGGSRLENLKNTKFACFTTSMVSKVQIFKRRSRADWPLFLKQSEIVQKVFSSIFDNQPL